LKENCDSNSKKLDFDGEILVFDDDFRSIRFTSTSSSTSTMSTQLPPPKRQKLNNVAHERDVKPTKQVDEPERYVPNIVVQFKNAEDGTPLGPAINLPANTGRDALQMLVNKLKGEVNHSILVPIHVLTHPDHCILSRLKKRFLTHSTSNLEMLLHHHPQTSSLELPPLLLSLHPVYKSTATSWTTSSKQKVLVSNHSTMGSHPKMCSRSCVNPRLCSE
jgi:hypothetical protein